MSRHSVRLVAIAALCSTACIAMPATAQMVGPAAGTTAARPSDAAATNAPKKAPPKSLLHDALGAPEALKLSGSIRMRGQVIENRLHARGVRDDQALELRSMLFAEYDFGGIRAGAEFADSRAYEQNIDSAVDSGDVNTTELVQYYVAADLGDALGTGSTSTLTAGRTTMGLGSKRLVTNYGWPNTAPTFTGVRFDHKSRSGAMLTAFWTMPGQRLPTLANDVRDNRAEWDRDNKNLQFFGAMGSMPVDKHGTALEVYAYRLYEKDGTDFATADRRLITPGVRLVRKPKAGKVDFDFEGIGQFGQVRATKLATDLADLDVAASYVHAELGHSFTGGWQPRVALLFDRATGDETGGKYTRFDTLFGSRYGDFGPTSFYGVLSRSNVVSGGVRVQARPGANTSLQMTARANWLNKASDSFGNSAVRDARGRSGIFAGDQVDVLVRQTLVPNLLTAELGGAYFARGSFFRHAPNARPDTGDMRYLHADLILTF